MNLTFSLHTGVRIFVGAIFILSSIGKFIDSSDAQYLVELMSMNIYWIIEYKGIIGMSIKIREVERGSRGRGKREKEGEERDGGV